MSRLATLGALVLALLALAVPRADAKGPTQVEVHDQRTGFTTVLGDRGEVSFRAGALQELVGWPDDPNPPRAMRRGALEHIATLVWQLPDGVAAWVDRVYSDGMARTWVERSDHLMEPGSVSWGRVEAAFAFDVVLSGVQEPATLEASSVPASTAARQPEKSSPSRETPERFDASSFAWGAALAGVLAAGLALTARWRRQRSVTASRNSRASSAAFS